MYDRPPISTADWMAKLRRDAKSHQDKKEKRKEKRRRDAEAQE